MGLRAPFRADRLLLRQGPVRPGGRVALLQYHEVKDETLYLQSGRADVTVGPSTGALEVVEAVPGAAFRVTPGTVHRITAIDDSTFLEVSTPELDDVVRLEDRYGRVREATGRSTRPA